MRDEKANMSKYVALITSEIEEAWQTLRHRLRRMEVRT